jgi:chromosome segregation ATPase
MKPLDVLHEFAPYATTLLALLAAIIAWLKADATKRSSAAKVHDAVASALDAYRTDLRQAQQLARDLSDALYKYRREAENEHARLQGALRGKEARIRELETGLALVEAKLDRAERREAALAGEMKETARAARAAEHLRIVERRDGE